MACDALDGDWRKQLRNARKRWGAPEVEALYPYFATPYWESLMCHKAIRLQTVPSREELGRHPGTSVDPFGERGGNAACRGAVRRFPDRMLVMVNDLCAMACRHCTRKNLLGDAQTVRSAEDIEEVVGYARSNPRIRDVLLSGGDALLLPDDRIAKLVDAFAALPQIDVVRICTRAPSTLPMRITGALVRKIKAVGRSKVWVNTQFNCSEELTPQARMACARLVDAGIPVSCQTVLLRGVNDSVGKMFKLCVALQQARVRPYYVFVCDPVTGTGHFRVGLDKAREIERKLAERIGGLAMPRFVADRPGAKRKVPLAELAAEGV